MNGDGETAMHDKAKGLAGIVSKFNFTRMRHRDRSTLVLWPTIDKIQEAISQTKSHTLEISADSSSIKIEMFVNGELAA